ncbi:MAG: hypothetical protein H6553_09755 [Chitinophagales bacterium]|nr:hypothetical protein [Chitinophagales bacterium]
MKKLTYIIACLILLKFVAVANTNNYTISVLQTQIDTSFHFNITVTDSMLLFKKSINQPALSILISDDESKVLKDFVFDTDSLFLSIDDLKEPTYLINIFTKDFIKNDMYQLNKLTKE